MFQKNLAGRLAWLLCALCAGAVCVPLVAQAQSSSSVASRQAALQAELNQLDSEISLLQTDLQSTQSQQNTLEGELKILNEQIQESKLAIQRRNLGIQLLSQSIQGKEDAISGLNDQLQGEYQSLAAILRESNQLDSSSIVVAALTSSSLSEFFADTDQFSQINESMQRSFTQIQSDTQTNEQQKTDLQSQLNQETQLRQVQQLQQQQLQAQQNKKNQLIAQTKGQEQSYQSLISSKQQTAAQIRATLFELTGTKAIPFEQALQYADRAEKETGIRPAFLLGIVTEESDLGQNVGTGSWSVDMNPTRDAPVFKAITESLGLNPNAMPVSKKAWYGWGGAMGPAQFIPSTWALYAGYAAPAYVYNPAKDRIGKLTGNSPPNPWNPDDAFMAAALYLTDDGAGTQTASTEFRAAMCYLAGCGNANNKDLQFYGNQVAGLAAEYQQQIDILNGS